MPGKIIYLNQEDFNQRGVFNQFHSECELDGSAFRKNDTFKHQEIKQVLETCKKYNNFGVNTLMIKSESDLTIWIEQISQRATNSDLPTAASQTDAPASQQALPTKTVTKRYRGQVYEETVVDWAAVAMQNKSLPTEGKQRRKYRGNYVD